MCLCVCVCTVIYADVSLLAYSFTKFLFFWLFPLVPWRTTKESDTTGIIQGFAWSWWTGTGCTERTDFLARFSFVSRVFFSQLVATHIHTVSIDQNVLHVRFVGNLFFFSLLFCLEWTHREHIHYIHKSATRVMSHIDSTSAYYTDRV